MMKTAVQGIRENLPSVRSSLPQADPFECVVRLAFPAMCLHVERHNLKVIHTKQYFHPLAIFSQLR